MDQTTEELWHKRKKYTKQSFLTTSKKCKCYRSNHTETSLQDNHLSHLSTSSSDESQSDQNDPSEYTCTAKERVHHVFSTAPYLRNKSTQIQINKKTASVQAVKLMRNKNMQTLKTRNSVQSSFVQTDEQVKPLTKKETLGVKLTDKLKASIDFEKFAQKLHDHEQTEKFVNSLSALCKGCLPFTNMAWKSFLEMGSLLSCTTTTRMEYDREWLEFCQVIYHMFGAGVINALCGRGHFSQVTSEKMKKGKYNPVTGEFNFPIPSIPTLKKLDIGFPSEIPVGIVEQSLQLAQKNAEEEGGQFVLSFDGKLIAPGCKGDSCSDSNMWGVEGPPNLSTAVKILKKSLKAARNINVDMREVSPKVHFTNLKHLLNVSSHRIKKCRTRITGCFYLKKKLIDKCGNSQELQYKNRKKMSTLNQNTADCESVVRRLLEMNLKITSIMAFLNSNGDIHIRDRTRHVNLSECANSFQLLPPEIVSQHTDLGTKENMQFIKQRSDKWFEIHKKYRVTGSTLNSALGLDTLQKQKEHHYVHVCRRKPPPIPPDLQKKFDHGTKNEVNATSTLITTVAPAFLSACYSFYKVGPAFVHMQDGKELLEVSADGVLQCLLGQNCPNYHIHGDRRIQVSGSTRKCCRDHFL